jgi:hypothetical protein
VKSPGAWSTSTGRSVVPSRPRVAKPSADSDAPSSSFVRMRRTKSCSLAPAPPACTVRLRRPPLASRSELPHAVNTRCHAEPRGATHARRSTVLAASCASTGAARAPGKKTAASARARARAPRRRAVRFEGREPWFDDISLGLLWLGWLFVEHDPRRTGLGRAVEVADSRPAPTGLGSDPLGELIRTRAASRHRGRSAGP